MENYLEQTMISKYSHYFGFKGEPFNTEVSTKDLLKLPSMIGVKERIDYTLNVGGVLVVSGDVGSGKSTSLRWGLSHYHTSSVLSLPVIANSGSMSEFYKQLCWSLDVQVKSGSRSLLLKTFKDTCFDISNTKKQKILLIIDEAHLLRPEIFAELHTLNQYKYDSSNIVSIVLAGQASLIDRLTYRTSLPIASRVIARTHLSSINLDQMEEYIAHHLKVVACKKNIFSESAIRAIHQGSGGLLRKANILARGGLVAAATESLEQVSAEHIRIASTEII